MAQDEELNNAEEQELPDEETTESGVASDDTGKA